MSLGFRTKQQNRRIWHALFCVCVVGKCKCIYVLIIKGASAMQVLHGITNTCKRTWWQWHL